MPAVDTVRLVALKVSFTDLIERERKRLEDDKVFLESLTGLSEQQDSIRPLVDATLVVSDRILNDLISGV